MGGRRLFAGSLLMAVTLAANAASTAAARKPPVPARPVQMVRPPVRFAGTQSLECSASDAVVIKVTAMITMRVDFDDTDTPTVSFTANGVTYTIPMISAGMACRLSGATPGGSVVKTVTGGPLRDVVGMRSFDSPQTITCYSNGARVSQDRGAMLTATWAVSSFTLAYSRADGGQISQQYASTTACFIEAMGQELLPLDANLPSNFPAVNSAGPADPLR